MKIWIVLVLLLGECVLLSAQAARSDERIPAGGDVTVPCENEGRVSWSKLAEGKREIILTAQHEQTPVKHKPDPDHRYTVLPDLTLLIKGASASDSGIYYCNATPVLELHITPVQNISTDDMSISATGGMNDVKKDLLVYLFALFLFFASLQ